MAGAEIERGRKTKKLPAAHTAPYPRKKKPGPTMTTC